MQVFVTCEKIQLKKTKQNQTLLTASTIRLNPHWSYLFVCAFECEKHVAHVARDKHHGGESHAPADPLAPGWEHVVAHGEGNHLHCTEQEHSLDTRDKEADLTTAQLHNC